jgi:hypothetical protein
VPLELQLFDGTGRLLGDWAVGGQATPDFHELAGGLAPGSTFYFGISAANQNGPAVAFATTGYQLWINLEPTASSTSGAATSAPAAPVASTLPPFSSTGLAMTTQSANSQTALPSASVGTPGAGVTVGSPAIRSVSPSGGLLSDGDPAPEASRNFNASINKQWDEKSPTDPAPRDQEQLEVAAISSAREQDDLVVLRGPGGVPLLGALAGGHRRSVPAPEIGDFAGPPEGPVQDASLPRVLLAQDQAGELVPLPAPAQWANVPATIFSGLGLASIFTLNAVLSQPIAGFDYLTKHFERAGATWGFDRAVKPGKGRRWP